MTPPVDAAARVLDKPEERESVKTGKIIYLSEKDFTWDQERKASWEDAEREFKERTATKGKLDAGRTVRSGLAYDFDSTDPIPPSDAERAIRVKAELGDEPLHGIENRPVYRFVKRTFDIAFSAAVLVAFSWLYLLIAILVKVDDPKGPVFFKQKRVTKNGREFYMYKFRSMCVDAEAKLAELQELNEKSGPVFKIADDPRITRVGKWIRKLSLDEMPQFFNVLMGHMSLVGTRPPTLDEWKKYQNHHRARMAAKPGITGMWQISGRSNITDFEEIVELDMKYIENWSFGLDIKIILLT